MDVPPTITIPMNKGVSPYEPYPLSQTEQELEERRDISVALSSISMELGNDGDSYSYIQPFLDNTDTQDMGFDDFSVSSLDTNTFEDDDSLQTMKQSFWDQGLGHQTLVSEDAVME